MNAPKPTMSLDKRAAVWRRDMASSMNGPLRIAEEVMDVVRNWDQYIDEAGGVSAADWSRKTFGLGIDIRYWQGRVDAIEKLGAYCGRLAKRYMHHEAAIWLANRNVGAPALRKIMSDIVQETEERNNHIPLSKAAVFRIAYTHVPGIRKRRDTCTACHNLEAFLRSQGYAESVIRNIAHPNRK